MVAEEVFENCYHFNHISYNFKVSCKSVRIQSRIQSRSWSLIRRRNSDLRLRGARAGAESNIFGSTTLVWIQFRLYAPSKNLMYIWISDSGVRLYRGSGGRRSSDVPTVFLTQPRHCDAQVERVRKKLCSEYHWSMNTKEESIMITNQKPKIMKPLRESRWKTTLVKKISTACFIHTQWLSYVYQ